MDHFKKSILSVGFIVTTLFGFCSKNLQAGVQPPWEGFSFLFNQEQTAEFLTGGAHGEVLLWGWARGTPEYRWLIPGDIPVVGIESASTSGEWLGVTLDGQIWSLVINQQPTLLPISVPSLQRDLDLWTKQSPFFNQRSLTKGAMSITSSPTGTITVKPKTGTLPLSWQAHSSAITGMLLSSDGEILLTVSWSGELRLWSLDTGKEVASLP